MPARAQPCDSNFDFELQEKSPAPGTFSEKGGKYKFEFEFEFEFELSYEIFLFKNRDGFGQEFCESSRVRVHEMRVEPSRVRDCELRVESSCELSSRVVEFISWKFRFFPFFVAKKKLKYNF